MEPNRLKELRTEYRLYQGEVTRFLGVTPAVVSRHETGEKGLSHDAAIKYARVRKALQGDVSRAVLRPRGSQGEPPEGTPRPLTADRRRSL